MALIELETIELSFLAEACIPPCTIARHAFWNRLIDNIYHQLMQSERRNLFNWIKEHNKFDPSNNECQWFYARFNPDNQYRVTHSTNGKLYATETFLKDGKYYIVINKYVEPDNIIKVEKL